MNEPTADPPKKKARITGMGCLGIAVGVVILSIIIAATLQSTYSTGISAPSTDTSAAPVAATATDMPIPTDIPIATDTTIANTPTPSLADMVASASGDTYSDVNDHPDLHQGDTVVWTCNIAKFMGTDPNDMTQTDIGCWEYTGQYAGGIGDGEIMLLVPFTIDTSAMNSGQNVMVYGTVSQPMQGTNAFNGTVTIPSIAVSYLVPIH